MSGSAIGGGQNIARTVVGIGVGVGVGVGGIPCRTEQLSLVVIGVGYGAFPGSGKGCDVTHAVIGIAIFFLQLSVLLYRYIWILQGYFEDSRRLVCLPTCTLKKCPGKTRALRAKV